MVGNRNDATDVMGQAMVNIVQGISGYRGPVSLSIWMIRVAMNTAISYRRKQRLRQTISLDGSDSNSHEDQSSPLREQLASERELAPDQSVE